MFSTASYAGCFCSAQSPEQENEIRRGSWKLPRASSKASRRETQSTLSSYNTSRDIITKDIYIAHITRFVFADLQRRWNEDVDAAASHVT